MNLTNTQKRQRMGMMLSGAFAIFFTGYPHVWAVYQPYVIAEAGWSQGQASMCFYLALAVFVFGNIFGGRIQDKRNPRLVILVGGGIFTAGVLLSAVLVGPSPLPIYITYGVMQGFGQGMIYITIISTAQKWFPGHTGFASGVVVTANGLCGFFLAPMSKVLLEAGGTKRAFLVIGGLIGASWILCTLFFFVPDAKWMAEARLRLSREESTVRRGMGVRQYTSMEMIRTRSFYLLLGTMLLGLLPYFLLSPVSQTYQMEQGISPAAAVGAVMAGSLVNAAARLVLPTVADKVGRSVCIKWVLITAIGAMLTLSLGSSYAVTAAIVIMYGCYGGIMGSFPSLTSTVFGMEHAGENYGYVMSGIVIATIASGFITSLVLGKGYGQQTVFVLGAVFAGAAFLCMSLLKRELEKSQL